jgi:hypothetical protein
MNARRVVLSLIVFSLYAGTAVAQTQAQPRPPLSNMMITAMFGAGILAIAATWITVPIIFARNGHLGDLIELLKRGAVMRFVTVTYIVIVTVTLALIDRLDGDKVATLLASIAGYVLGSATGAREEREESSHARKAPTEPRAAETTLVRADERPRPAPQVGSTGS